jgi:hypothetical protein
MSSLTLNEKGAVSYRHTFSSLLDLFGQNITNGDDVKEMSYEEFNELFETCYKAYVSDPNLFIAMLAYRRSIHHVGQKMMYYIMMYIVRTYHNYTTFENSKQTREVKVINEEKKEKKENIQKKSFFSMFVEKIAFKRKDEEDQIDNEDEKIIVTKEFSKEKNDYIDILNWSHACKKDLLRMSRIYSSVSPSSTFPELQLASNMVFDYISKDENESNLLFKYLGTDHFEKENKIIRDKLNRKLQNNDLSIYSNKMLRKFYSSQKSRLYLVDYLLRGEKEDGRPITIEDEDYVVDYLKKVSAKAFKKVMKTISHFGYSTKDYQQVLYRAYQKIQSEIVSKKFSVKSTGMNPIEDCYFYRNKNEIDPILESMLDTKLQTLKTRVKNILTDSSIDLVIDNSGSMDGQPIQTAWYITMMMHKLCHLSSFIVFNTTASKHFIESSEASEEKTWKDTIDSIYRPVRGSTYLDTIFPHLENNDNLTLILTDGDCDPNSQGNNPFQEALNRFPKRKFVVWNLKNKKLCFPYSSLDDRVGYISGNEIGLVEAVFSSLPNISPIGLMRECLKEFTCPFIIEVDPKHRSIEEEERVKLYDSIKHNIPK